jgi:polynucleotide 5'-hydroxyl-kinase GRC3/NOL9
LRFRLITLLETRVLLIKGPATAVCEGTVNVLGMDVSWKEISIRSGKVLPFEAVGRSKIKISLGRWGSYKILSGKNVGISIWKDLAKYVVTNKPKCIVLVGANDTGKSTLTAYLSNIAIANGLKVSIVDGDVGQGDLAPPGCIGASKIEKQFLDLRDINAQYYRFIGAPSPRGIEGLVIRSLKDLADRLSTGSDICIINTDGYIDDHGIDYKIELVETLNPDLIVYLGNPTQGKKLDKFKNKLIRLHGPILVSKTHREREKRRLEQYSRFIPGGKPIMFEIRSKKFSLSGNLYELILKDNLIRLGSKEFLPRLLHGMFVGLSKAGNVKGFGAIVHVANDKIIIKAKSGDFDTVLLSNVRLSSDMKRQYQIPLFVDAHSRSK